MLEELFVRKQVADFINAKVTDSEVTQIIESGYLAELFVYAGRAWVHHDENYPEMMRGDLFRWIKDIVDVHITLDNNSKAEAAKNPKKKAKPGKIYNIAKGETFGAMLMPARYKKLFGDAETIKKEREAEYEQKLEENLPGTKRRSKEGEQG